MKINAKKVEEFLKNQQVNVKWHDDSDIKLQVAGNATIDGNLYASAALNNKIRVRLDGIEAISFGDFKKRFKKE